MSSGSSHTVKHHQQQSQRTPVPAASASSSRPWPTHSIRAAERVESSSHSTSNPQNASDKMLNVADAVQRDRLGQFVRRQRVGLSECGCGLAGVGRRWRLPAPVACAAATRTPHQPTITSSNTAQHTLLRTIAIRNSLPSRHDLRQSRLYRLLPESPSRSSCHKIARVPTRCRSILRPRPASRSPSLRIRRSVSCRSSACRSSVLVLLDAMTAELQRAFTSLGQAGPNQKDATSSCRPTSSATPSAMPTSVSIRAQYGALADSSSQPRRAWPTSRSASATPSSTTPTATIAAPPSTACSCRWPTIAQALARTLWLATNAGYGNALDNYLRVKTEAQVRAKEEDSSPDFSQEPPQVSIGKPAPPVVDRPRRVGTARQRVSRSVFRDYPDVYQNMVMLTVQNETDYYASSEGSRVVAPHHAGTPGRLRRHPRRRRHGPVPRPDLRSRNRRRPALAGRSRSRHPRTGQEPRSAAQSARHRAFRWPGHPLRSRLRRLLSRSARPPPRRPAPARRRRRPDLHQGTEQGRAPQFPLRRRRPHA